MQLLLCYDNEGVYVNTYGKVSTDLQAGFFRNYFVVDILPGILMTNSFQLSVKVTSFQRN
jgi:hypothetical protein